MIPTEVRNNDIYVPTSRYKGTKYFQRDVENVGSRIEPELWNPDDIPVSPSDLYTVVQAGEEGRLDLVSLRVYRIESLWWVIAFANDIIDPFEETTVNKVLRYPTFEWVSSNILS